MAHLVFPQISNLNTTNEPSRAILHQYSCGFERDEDALEAHTQWVRNRISLPALVQSFLEVRFPRMASVFRWWPDSSSRVGRGSKWISSDAQKRAVGTPLNSLGLLW